jgi:hypothetical protein
MRCERASPLAVPLLREAQAVDEYFPALQNHEYAN